MKPLQQDDCATMFSLYGIYCSCVLSLIEFMMCVCMMFLGVSALACVPVVNSCARSHQHAVQRLRPDRLIAVSAKRCLTPTPKRLTVSMSSVCSRKKKNAHLVHSRKLFSHLSIVQQVHVNRLEQSCVARHTHCSTRLQGAWPLNVCM